METSWKRADECVLGVSTRLWLADDWSRCSTRRRTTSPLLGWLGSLAPRRDARCPPTRLTWGKRFLSTRPTHANQLSAARTINWRARLAVPSPRLAELVLSVLPNERNALAGAMLVFCRFVSPYNRQEPLCSASVAPGPPHSPAQPFFAKLFVWRRKHRRTCTERHLAAFKRTR